MPEEYGAEEEVKLQCSCTRRSVNPKGSSGASMPIHNPPNCGKMATPFTPAKTSHWIQAAPTEGGVSLGQTASFVPEQFLRRALDISPQQPTFQAFGVISASVLKGDHLGAHHSIHYCTLHAPFHLFLTTLEGRCCYYQVTGAENKDNS